MNTYSSLALAIENHLESPLADLPSDIRLRVEQEFLPMPWDKLSPENRRIVAAQLDYQRDPATESERQYWSKFFEQRDELLKRLARWKSVETPTATDLAAQETKVRDLQQEVDRMELTLRQGRGDFYPENPIVQEVANSRHAKPLPVKPTPLKPDVSEDRCAIFRSMENLGPDELAISFVGDTYESGVAGNNMLEITAREITRRIALAEFDLVDRRSGVLNQQAAILIGLAQGLRIKRRDERHATTMKRLRDVFRNRLGISGDPFAPHTNEQGWLPRFKIADLRGQAADRARQLAELRTVSYEAMEDSGHQFAATDANTAGGEKGDEDEADRWIRKHGHDNEA